MVAVPSGIVEHLDDRYPQANAGKPFFLTIDHTPGLAYTVDLLDQMPEGMIDLIRGPEKAAFCEALAAARHALTQWNGGIATFKFEKIPGRGNENPLSIIRRALVSLPDEIIDPGTAELDFITDRDLRDGLRADISGASRSFDGGDWKGCTVVAGSVVEALLLWALTKRS